MTMIWSVIWGVAAFIIMAGTTKYYLPGLALRVQSAVSEEDSENTKFMTESRRVYTGIMAASVLFAACCGYAAAVNSTSMLNLLKMTFTFAVLACVFVTDLELKIIPNACSVILLTGRVLTIIYEFIRVRESAGLWLTNTIVAAVASTILLLLVSKLTGGGIGFGDVKIFSMIGFMCGISAVCFSLLLSFLTCAVFSTGLLAAKKKKMKDSLPLGPFIWIGYGICILLSII